MKQKTSFSKNYAVISAIGKDQPGIVAAVSKALFEAGCNLEDSSMTLLGGEFAIILVVTLPFGLDLMGLDRKFDSARQALHLTVFLKAITPGEMQRKPLSGSPYMISVYGVDKSGIVYNVTSLLAKSKVNITDVNTQRIVQKGAPIYVMMLEVSCPKSLDINELNRKLTRLGRKLSVTITSHPIETLTL